MASTLEESLVSADDLHDTRLDFIYNDLLTKDVIPPKEVEKAFCLDLNLGKKYDDMIISCLEIVFENPTSKFLHSVFLKNVVQCLQNEDFCRDLMSVSNFKRKINLVFSKDLSNLKDYTKTKLTYILTMLYQAFPSCDTDIDIKFDKFDLVVEKKNVNNRRIFSSSQ